MMYPINLSPAPPTAATQPTAHDSLISALVAALHDSVATNNRRADFAHADALGDARVSRFDYGTRAIDLVSGIESGEALYEGGLTSSAMCAADMPLSFFSGVLGKPDSLTSVASALGLRKEHLRNKLVWDPVYMATSFELLEHKAIDCLNNALKEVNPGESTISARDIIRFGWTEDDFVVLGIDFAYLYNDGGMKDYETYRDVSTACKISRQTWDFIGMTEGRHQFMLSEFQRLNHQ
jgi:hypothetical protein